MLVKGTDSFRNFEETPIPSHDFDPIAVAFHKKAANAINEVLYNNALVNDHKL